MKLTRKQKQLQRAKAIRENSQKIIDYLETDGKTKAMAARKWKTSQTVIDSACVAGGRADLSAPSVVENYRDFAPSIKETRMKKENISTEHKRIQAARTYIEQALRELS